MSDQQTVPEVKNDLRGICKSGRFWKSKKEPFNKLKSMKSSGKVTTSAKIKTKQLKLREEMRRIKELSRSIKEEKKQVS